MTQNQSSSQTQKRLLKWQESPSAWELRRILSDSEHFRVIAIFAFRRQKQKKLPEGLEWKDWWGFYLEKMPEVEAIRLLLAVWNKDLKAYLAKSSRQRAEQIIAGIAEHSQQFPGIKIDLGQFKEKGGGAPLSSEQGESCGGSEPSGKPDAQK